MDFKKQLSFIDFAKGYAIITIVLFHYLYIFASDITIQRALNFGGTGVHLFFFLSGYGLCFTSSKTPVQFYKRRFFKIYIPYIVFITFMFIINKILLINPEEQVYAYLGHVFLYKMFDSTIINSFGIQYWYLSAIFQLYLIFPFIYLLSKKISVNRFFYMALFISVLYWIFLFIFKLSELETYRRFFLQYIWIFALGMAFSEKSIMERISNLRLVYLILSMIIALPCMLFLVIYLGKTGRIFNDIPAFIGYTSLSLIIFRVSNNYLNYFNRIIIWIGTFSFSLFLTHWFIIKIYFYLVKRSDGIISITHIFALIPIALIFAYIYDRIIKRKYNSPQALNY